MSYYIIGSNHELADTTFSSKISFDDYKKNLLIQQLIDNQLADSVIILSTCNRSEVFVFCSDVIDENEWTKQINQHIVDLHGLNSSDLSLFYSKLNQHACFHLFKVTCGLDSLVLGESQITSQLKDAFNFTKQFHERRHTKVPNEIHNLISFCFSCAKEVRTKTLLGKFTVSIAYLACKLAREMINNFSDQHILLIGASQTNLLLARHLIRNGISNIYVVNRTLKNAQKFVEEIGCGEAFELNKLPELLPKTNLIFSSTSSNSFVLDTSHFRHNTKKHKTIIFDLAIPNDIDSNVGKLENIELYNRDHLQEMVNSNKQKRIQAIDETLPIIKKYLNDFIVKNRIKQGNEIIIEYRNAIHNQRKQMLKNAQVAILRGDDPLKVIETFSVNLTNKILHTPTLILSSMIKSGKLCTLSKLHTYLDRSIKDNLQDIIVDTLSKDSFKSNKCCKMTIDGKFESQEFCDNQYSNCKCPQSQYRLNVGDSTEFFESNKNTTTSVNICPFSNNHLNSPDNTEKRSNKSILPESINDYDEITSTSSIDSLKGIFVPFEFPSSTYDENLISTKSLLDDLNYLDQNIRIIHLNKNSYIEEPISSDAGCIGYVKFVETKK